MPESLVIYNCETCMFLTRNKKDYTRHLKTRKHIHLSLESAHATTPQQQQQQQPHVCVKCNKEFKSRTSVYSHIKKCIANSSSVPVTETIQHPSAEKLTTEQIQYILIENKILKDLLKNVIQEQRYKPVK